MSQRRAGSGAWRRASRINQAPAITTTQVRITLAWAPGMARPESGSKAEASCHLRSRAAARAAPPAEISQAVRPDTLFFMVSTS